MLYKLIKKIGNKKPIIDMIGELSKVNDRKKTLKDSYRGKNITITVEPADEEDTKFRKKPVGGFAFGAHSQYANQPKRAKNERF